MKFKTLPLFLIIAAGLSAQISPADLERQTKDIDRRQQREEQKIDQAEELERVKLRTRQRDELAKIQREGAIAVSAQSAAVAASGNLAGLNMTKLAEMKFSEDEVHNLIDNQLSPEVSARFKKDRQAVVRKYTVERAKLEAQQIDAGDDTAKQRETALKKSDVTAKFQAQIDDLEVEQDAAAAKLRFGNTTKINAAERDLAAMTAKHLVDQMQKGAAAVYNPAADPEYAKLAGARDAARSELETALDEQRAKFNAKRTDIENARDDEMAKISG